MHQNRSSLKTFRSKKKAPPVKYSDAKKGGLMNNNAQNRLCKYPLAPFFRGWQKYLHSLQYLLAYFWA